MLSAAGGICGSGLVTNSSFLTNKAFTFGGAIVGMVITNCTFFGNSALYGGGAIYGGSTVTNSTFFENYADSGGAVVAASLKNTIIAGPPVGQNCGTLVGTVATDAGYNISDDNFLRLPLAHSNTIRARSASACAVVGRRTQLSKLSHSAAARLKRAWSPRPHPPPTLHMADSRGLQFIQRN